MITNYGREQLAIRMGSNTNVPGWIGVGSGSAALVITNVVLKAEWDRMPFTNPINYSGAQEISFQADWNSVQASGKKLTEFGVFTTGADLAGSLWHREGFATTTFDGSNELQIEIVEKII